MICGQPAQPPPISLNNTLLEILAVLEVAGALGTGIGVAVVVGPR